MSAQSGIAPASLTASLRRWSAAGAEPVRRGGRWWLHELLALFPARVSDWLTDRGSKTLVLAAEPDAVLFDLIGDRRRRLASLRVSRADYAPDLLDSFLQSHRLQRRDVSIGCALPRDTIFVRNVLLPIETERDLAAVLVQDLSAKTPFRLEDIHHDHVAHRSGDKLAVTQRIVRRQFVEDAADALGLAADDLAFVEAQGQHAGDHPEALLRLREPPAERGRWARRGCILLALTACLLAILALGSKYWRQEVALAGIATELAAVKHEAQRVRAMMDRLEGERADLLRLRSGKRDMPGFLDVWEELTRLLPSHSWLTELRMSEGPGGGERQVVISGLSGAAASLVGLLDRSPMFGDAALTAPVAIDRVEEKERFVIQARLKKPYPPGKGAP
jgi:general secretion pathway protein L